MQAPGHEGSEEARIETGMNCELLVHSSGHAGLDLPHSFMGTRPSIPETSPQPSHSVVLIRAWKDPEPWHTTPKAGR